MSPRQVRDDRKTSRVPRPDSSTTALLQSEEHERLAESHAERELRLEIRRLEIEADTQIKLRELELNAARKAPVPPVQSAQNAAPPTDSGSSGRTFDVSKHISLILMHSNGLPLLYNGLEMFGPCFCNVGSRSMCCSIFGRQFGL